jgi:hypothetical protein
MSAHAPLLGDKRNASGRDYEYAPLTGATGLTVIAKNTGARWEITVDGKPRTYDHSKQLAIEAAQYLKLKNPNADVTVRDLEGIEATIIIPAQQPRVRR